MLIKRPDDKIDLEGCVCCSDHLACGYSMDPTAMSAQAWASDPTSCNCNNLCNRKDKTKRGWCPCFVAGTVCNSGCNCGTKLQKCTNRVLVFDKGIFASTNEDLFASSSSSTGSWQPLPQDTSVDAEADECDLTGGPKTKRRRLAQIPSTSKTTSPKSSVQPRKKKQLQAKSSRASKGKSSAASKPKQTQRKSKKKVKQAEEVHESENVEVDVAMLVQENVGEDKEGDGDDGILDYIRMLQRDQLNLMVSSFFGKNRDKWPEFQEFDQDKSGSEIEIPGPSSPGSGPPSPGSGPSSPGSSSSAASLDWCKCGHCQRMPTAIEDKCCRFRNQGPCTSLTEQFRQYVLDNGNLRIAVNNRNDIFAENNNPNHHSTMRHTAYRQFILWQHGKLGQGNRRVVPSCCVLKVRSRYPSEDGRSIGYRPARLD